MFNLKKNIFYNALKIIYCVLKYLPLFIENVTNILLQNFLNKNIKEMQQWESKQLKAVINKRQISCTYVWYLSDEFCDLAALAI